jgi:RNA polymerase sigma factor (sigma-70 family)
MSGAAAAPRPSSLLSDERLTRRAVGGDERAFAAIFRRYHQPLYRFCLAIVGNRDDAQEALQNAMVKVMRALPGEERRIELKPWLYRIAHNESIDLLRRRRATQELDVEQIGPGYGLAEDAAARERLRALIADLKELPERQREVLVMRELGGLGFDEIGIALGTSGAVARQTLYEARQSLRQMEEGREMGCEQVMRALSEGDGRVTRRRDLRAHLRACRGCSAFGEEIKRRERDFAALSPLPAVAAAGMLQALIGGSQGPAAAGGLAATLGGGAAKTIGASAAAKGVATAAVVAAIGVTAADQAGVVHLGLPGDRKARHSAPAAGAGGSAGAVPGPRQSGAAAGAGAPSSAGSEGAGGVGGATPAPSAKATPSQQAAAARSQAGGGSQEDLDGERPTRARHPHGRGHEKRHPAAAAGGQGTAAGHKAAPGAAPASGEPTGAGAGSGGARAAKPSHPVPGADAPPQEGPANSEAAPSASTRSQAAEQPPSPPASAKRSAGAGERAAGQTRPAGVRHRSL